MSFLHLELAKQLSQTLAVDKNVIGILVTGSVAHGYATADSDLDLVIIVKETEFERRKRLGSLNDRFTKEFEGTDILVDIKYLSIKLIKRITTKASEAARYMYKDAIILYSLNDSIKELTTNITKYPVEHKDELLRRFYAQLFAWRSFYYEAVTKKNDYLLNYAVDHFILFCGRIILTYNEMLFPSPKWLMNEVAKAPDKPDGILVLFNELLNNKDQNILEEIYSLIKNIQEWNISEDELMKHYRDDIELMWLNQEPSIYEI